MTMAFTRRCDNTRIFFAKPSVLSVVSFFLETFSQGSIAKEIP
jgi:hypothetical protein